MSYSLKLVVFDLDETLHFNDSTRMPHHVRDILNYFMCNNVPIALASLNIEAYKYLQYYNIERMFQAVEARKYIHQIKTISDSKEYMYPTKKYMFKRLFKKFRCLPQEVLLFDDVYENIHVARSLEMNAVQVDARFCVRWIDVFEGLGKFHLNVIKRRRTTEF